MKALRLSIIFFITGNFSANANEIRYYIFKKENIVFRIGFEYYDEGYKPAMAYYNDTLIAKQIQQQFLNKIARQLQLNKKPYKIDILVNSYPFYNIYDSYWHHRSASLIAYTTGVFHDSALQIYYDHVVSDTSIHYDRIYTLVKYATDNFEKVKMSQRVMTFTLPAKKCLKGENSNIYLTSIDTAIIQAIPTEHIDFDPIAVANKTNKHWVPIGILLAIAGLLVVKSSLPKAKCLKKTV